MAQTHSYGWTSGVSLGTYGTPLLPTGAEGVGGFLPTIVEDGSDTTLVRWSSNGLFGYAINDPRIPTASTGVQVNLTVRHSNSIPSGDQYKIAKYRSASVTIAAMSDGTSGPVTDSATAFTDGNGNALTPANFAATYWGSWADGFGTYLQRIQELLISYVFTLPTPGATTNSATGVSSSQATLNAAVDPNTATSTYPVSYYFEWGLTPSFGSVTSTKTLTGSGSNSVSETITGLSAGSTYYFRIKAFNADTTVTGATVNFTAGSAVISGRRGFASL